MTRSFTKWSSLALALASTGAGAASPPNYDVLQDPAPSPGSAPRTTLQGSPMSRQSMAVEVAHRDEQRGVPTFVWADRQEPVTAARARLLKGLKPDEAAREQLSKYLPLYGHTTLASAGADLKAVSQDASGVTVVTFAQQVDGVEVFRQELKVLLDKNNELVALSGTLSPTTAIPRPSMRPQGARAQWTAAQAVAAAYRDLTGTALDSGLLERMNSRAGDDYTHYQLASYARRPAQDFVIPARARQVLYPLPGGLESAYYVEVNTGAHGATDSDYYAYVLSATDGRLLMRNNLTANADFSYRVWADTTSPFTPQDGPSGNVATPHPTGIPGTYTTPPFVAPSLISLQNSPFSRNDPWLAASATQTTGNNVDAYADLVAPDGFNTGDLRASVTAPGVFDRSMDMTLQPGGNPEQIQAAVTQLFYVNNWLHDWFYDSGFNEAAGNAQTSNFGRGGREADSIRAEAQDYLSRNNANMSTPADGGRPRMQMYLFDNTATYLQVTEPSSVAGRYSVGTANFGAQRYNLTAPVVIAASGSPSNTLGCDPFTNAAAVSGKIAFVDRGTCAFAIKARNAQAAGAVGILIANNVAGTINVGDTVTDITIPIQTLTLADGNKLRAAAGLTAQMFSQVLLDLDGTIDNAIVAHEWGHYISNRLVGNANGLTNNQGRSMGEGWGDFHALLMMTRAEDINVASNANWNGVYAAGEYATRSNSDTKSTFFGIRRVGYSADMSKNALTFKHISDSQTLPTTAPINPGGVNSEVHNSGEIWTTMLWESYVSLLRAYPHDEAQRRMKQYLVNGYKMTPVAPTYTEARDAIIAAATAGDKADGQRFWKAFARRGAGAGAVSPPRSSTNHNGVIESYDFTAVTGFALEVNRNSGQLCDADDILDNGESALLRMTVRNVGEDQTQPVDLRVAATSVVTLGNGGVVQVPALKSGQEVQVSLPVSLTGATTRQAVQFVVYTREAGPPVRTNPKGQIDTFVNYDVVPNASATEDVEAPVVPWSVQHVSTLSDLDWGIALFPTATNHVFYGQNVDGPSDMRLITPPLQVGTTQPLVLNFKHAWSFEYATNPDTGALEYYDGAVIELSQDDGQTWVDVGTPLYNGTLITYTGNPNPLQGRKAFVGASTGYPSFVAATLDLGTAYAGKTVRLRFRVGSDLNTAAVGWLVDDLAFSGITNTPFTGLLADDGVCTTAFPPTVSAGPDVRADERSVVTLRGTVDAPQGATTSAQWRQIAGPTVVLRDSLTFTPSFVAPEVTTTPAQLVFELTGTSNNVSATDTVVVTVVNVNRPPTVNAGVAGVVNERASYTLSGSATDPDGDTLTYSWAQASGTPVALRGATTLTPSFTAPEVLIDETIPFVLSVSDGQATVRATVNVTVRNVNRAPVANAGDAFSVNSGDTASLNGSRSSDPDGDALTYAWTQVAGPAVTLTGATTAAPSFTAPSVDSPTELRFQLAVKDSTLSSEPALVSVTVKPINRAPTANAGVASTVDERTNYTLSGSASDVDGDTLTYTWVQLSGTPVALRNATTLTPSFTAPEVTADETLTFELAVSDGKATTRATVNVTVRNVNRAPVANAGDAFSVTSGATASLNGGRSSDADGDMLSYEWTQVSGPAVTLTGANTATPSFTAPTVDTQTELRFQLVVRDGALASEAAFVTVTVTKTPNRAPTANAGMAGVVDERASYTLSGSASDADGDTLTYTWVQLSGTPVALRNATTLQPSFTAPEVNADETLTFELAVSDGKATTRATVSVTVHNVNRAPVANAGDAFSVASGAAASLNGSRSSDADGDTLSYEWTQVAGPTVTLTGATTATPSFTAPTVSADETLRFRLVVKDATLTSEPAFVTVTVTKTPNRAPTANAGVTGTVDERANYTLSGSASDADGDTLTYTWVQTAGTSVALRNATTLQPSFTAPEVNADETLTFELAVSDGKATTRASVNVTVRNLNRAPVANAGDAFSVNAGATASLNGSRSSDPDGDTLSYAWTQESGPAVTLSGATTATPSFTAPSVAGDRELRFRLVVKDATLTSEPSFVVVTVKQVNRAPTANAGVTGVVDERASYTLMGSATDPDGDTLTYTWVQTAGTPVGLRNATTLQPSFTAPEVSADETLTFELAVNDGKATTRASVNVTVRNVNRAPVANAGDAFSVNVGESARLNGSRSSDADGDTLSYAWTQESGPTVTLTGATTAMPSFTAPSAESTLRFRLVVKDASLTSEPAFVTVTVKPGNRAPTVNAGVTGVVDERASYTLVGSVSDADGDTLTYTWVQTAGTPAALRGATTLQAHFTAPEVSADETLTFELVVSDGKATTRASVNVQVRNVNRAPTALVGDAFSVNAEAAAQLNGGRSTDADGDTLSYTWTQVSGPTVTLSGANTVTASFTAPSVEAQTELRFQLVVKDATLSSEPAFINVTVLPKPVAPAPEPTTPEQRGCSTTGAGAPLGLMGLALLALARRRRELY